MLATGLVSFLVARVSRLVPPAINVFTLEAERTFICLHQGTFSDPQFYNSFTPLPFFVGSLSFTAGNTTTGNE